MPSYFTKLQTPHGMLDFHIMRVLSVRGPLYYVTVRDKLYNIYNIEFVEQEGQWRMATQSVPDWLRAIEDQLCQVIQERLTPKSS